jgi:cytochrome c biogenesis protein CcmG, thiol:disulfide interchange protein DsbE
VKHPFRWITLAVGIAVSAFAVVLAVNVSTDPRSDFNTSRLLGKPAPAFTLTDLAGKRVGSEDLLGKTVIVNFWNSWCAPCADELPTLQRWYATHRSDPDVVLLGIPRDDTAGAIRQAARDDHMPWAVANDRGAEAATIDYATRGQPETFAISPRGRVVGSVIGPVTVGQLDRMVTYAQRDAA